MTEGSQQDDVVDPAHWALAALLAGAGAIHLAMAPPHLAESTADGAGFVVAGVTQLGLAVWVAARPRRLALWLVVASSAVLIGGWAVSRTAGLPYGQGAIEDVTSVDAICVVLEALAIVLAGTLLVRRGAVVRSSPMAVVGVVAALALSGAALASPAARDHADGGHGHGESAQGESGTDGGHGHGTDVAAAEDDLGFAALANGQMGAHDHSAAEAEAAATAAPTELGPRVAGALAVQLAGTAPLVEAYPTLGAALDAGFARQGPFSPGLGLHVSGPFLGGLNLDGDMDAADLGSPTLIYDGTTRDARLAGFMYMAYQDTEPKGFAGPLDRWHYHTAVCIAFGPNGLETPFGADLTDVTDEMCEDAGGWMLDFTGYMVHVWTVPGYESPLGTFSDLNPKITCPDGTYHTVPTAEIGSRQSTCRFV